MKDKSQIEEGSKKSSEISENEIALIQKYCEYKSILDERKTSYLDLFKKTLIISTVISLSMIITTSVILNQMNEVLIGNLISSVRIEVKEVVNQMNVGISELTNVIKSEISSSFEKINEQIPVVSERVTNKIVDKIETLPNNIDN